MFIRDQAGKVEFVPEMSDNSLTDGRERIGTCPTNFDIVRCDMLWKFSIEEANHEQKYMEFVAYCTHVTEIAKKGGKPVPKILALVGDNEKACDVVLLLQSYGLKSLPMLMSDPLERRLFLVKHFAKSVDVLVCTDTAVAGLQIPFVDHVVHLDLPSRENFANFGVHSSFAHQPNVANGDQIGGHVHSFFDNGRDQDVAQMLVDYINEHQVGQLPL